MNKSFFFKALGYIAFLAIGFYFLQKTFGKEDLSQIGSQLLSANLWWIALVLIVSFVGHIIRSLRWQQLINSSDENVKLTPIFHSLLLGYAVNYLIPRIGEIVRCASLNKTTKVPVTRLFGTVLIERMLDMCSLLIVLPTIFFMQYDRFKGLINDYVLPWLQPYYQKVIDNWLLVAALVIGGFVALYFFGNHLDKKEEEKKAEGKTSWADEMWEGILSIKKVKNIPLLIGYTFLIWGYYFTTNYLCFFALDSSLQEKWSAALATGAFGSIGRSLPIAGGGMGAYHFIIKEVLLQFGVTALFATSMSVILHGVQMLFHVFFGAIGGLYMWSKSMVKKDETTEIIN